MTLNKYNIIMCSLHCFVSTVNSLLITDKCLMLKPLKLISIGYYMYEIGKFALKMHTD